jgi:cytochrome P450
VTQHGAFPKPLAIYKLLSIFGSNILATEGEEWRRHRKIVARSFGETNHRLVWEETIKIVLDLFAHWDRQNNGDEIKLPSVRGITREIAVMVIGIASADPCFTMNRGDTDFLS